jgi:hypothetical protein
MVAIVMHMGMKFLPKKLLLLIVALFAHPISHPYCNENPIYVFLFWE